MNPEKERIIKEVLASVWDMGERWPQNKHVEGAKEVVLRKAFDKIKETVAREGN